MKESIEEIKKEERKLKEGKISVIKKKERIFIIIKNERKKKKGNGKKKKKICMKYKMEKEN